LKTPHPGLPQGNYSPGGRRKKTGNSAFLFSLLYELDDLYELDKLDHPIPAFPKGKEKENRQFCFSILFSL